jgi:hypothetical protein
LNHANLGKIGNAETEEDDEVVMGGEDEGVEVEDEDAELENEGVEMEDKEVEVEDEGVEVDNDNALMGEGNVTPRPRNHASH